MSIRGEQKTVFQCGKNTSGALDFTLHFCMSIPKSTCQSISIPSAKTEIKNMIRILLKIHILFEFLQPHPYIKNRSK